MIGTATIIGEEIKYTLDPLSNVSSIDSFTDSITGETATRYFEKYFRFSQEGLYFSDYYVLTSYTLSQISTDALSSYVIEIKYVRAGSDSTGDLTLNSISIQSTPVTVDNGYEFNHSNFAKFFESNDVDVMKWTLNVLKKIFEYGQLATYILRGEVSEIAEDPPLITSSRQFADLSLHLWSDNSQANFVN